MGLVFRSLTEKTGRNGRRRHIEGSGWAIGGLGGGLDSAYPDGRKGTDSRKTGYKTGLVLTRRPQKSAEKGAPLR